MACRHTGLSLLTRNTGFSLWAKNLYYQCHLQVLGYENKPQTFSLDPWAMGKLVIKNAKYNYNLWHHKCRLAILS